jgi:hypothetical protein
MNSGFIGPSLPGNQFSREVRFLNELFELAIAVHGGLERWTAISQITADLSIGGGVWTAKGKAGIQIRFIVQVQRGS